MPEEYFPDLTDEEIMDRVNTLPESQKKEYDSHIRYCSRSNKIRHSLFIALSWPIEKKEEEEKGATVP